MTESIISRSGRVIGSVAGPQAGDQLTFDSAVNQFTNAEGAGIPFLFPDHGHGWGAMFAYNNEIYLVGSANAERIHGWSQTANTERFMRRMVYNPHTWPLDISKCIEGVSYAHFLTSDGYLYSAGDDDLGQQGTNTSPAITPAVAASHHGFLLNRSPVIYGPGITILDVWSQAKTRNESTNSSGSLWVLVDDNGTKKLYAAGYNSEGVLGIGGSANTGELVQNNLTILDGKGVAKLHCHTDLMLLCTDSGEVYGAGYNNTGALGNTYLGASAIMAAVWADGTPVTTAVDVKAGWISGVGACSFILHANGQVSGSGTNYDGGLSYGSNSNRNAGHDYLESAAGVPITGITKIDSVVGMCFMLDGSGNLWASGRNHDGIFGDGSADYTYNPYASIIQTDIEDFWIVGGNERGWVGMIFKKTDGTVWGSGNNADYQLSIPSIEGRIDTAMQINIPPGEVLQEVHHYGGISDADSVYYATGFLMESGNLYMSGQIGMFGIGTGPGGYAIQMQKVSYFK